MELPASLSSLPEPEAGELADLEGLMGGLGYSFARPALLRAALSAGSWCNEHPGSGWPSNAVLEFFGDAVLDLLAAEALWHRFPRLAEGALTRLRATLVEENSLAAAAKSLGLGPRLFLGRGDEERGGRDRATTLADAFEAVLGAVFLDARAAGRDPLEAGQSVFERCFGERLENMDAREGLDPKSRLQQEVQSRYRRAPRYERLGSREGNVESGAPSQQWGARVVLPADPRGGEPREDQTLAEAWGASIKEAERLAARNALDHFSS